MLPGERRCCGQHLDWKWPWRRHPRLGLLSVTGKGPAARGLDRGIVGRRGDSSVVSGSACREGCDGVKGALGAGGAAEAPGEAASLAEPCARAARKASKLSKGRDVGWASLNGACGRCGRSLPVKGEIRTGKQNSPEPADLENYQPVLTAKG